MSRVLALCLLAACLPCAAKTPCLLDYKSWFDATVTGFTYDGIKVKKGAVDEKDGIVHIEVVNGNTTNKLTLSTKEWAMAESGCVAGNVPEGIKKKLGLSATGAGGAAVMAAVDFDTGDLNADGLADHVKVAFPANALIVELATAANRFGPRVNYPTGVNPQAVALADFNNDSRLDAAVANGGEFNQTNGSVSVLLGNGDGTFRPAVEYARGGGFVASLAVADLNGDGRLDVALARQGAAGAAGNIAVLLGDGAGVFGPPAPYATELAPYSLVAADFTGDQRLDLAAVNRDSASVTLLAGNGGGGFAAAVHTPIGAQPEYLGALDINLDGRSDLFVLHKNSATLSSWLAQANGAFAPAGRYLTGAGAGSFTIVQYESDPPIALVPDGVRPRMLIHGINTNGALTGASAWLVGANPRAFAAADFNGDGRPDLAVAEDGARLSLLLSRPSGGFEDPRKIAVSTTAAALAAGDFNGDNRADLAVGSPGRVSILTGAGDGTFQPGASLSAGNQLAFLCALDVNNDGRLDLAALNNTAQGTVLLFRGNGNGTFGASVSYPAGSAPRFATAADLNRDGRSDLVVVNSGSGGPASVSVYLGGADGALTAAANIAAGVSAESAAVADLNRDGVPDIAFTGLSSNSPNFLFHVSVAAGNGDGTFRDRVTTRVDDGPGALAAGDFDRDGLTDLLVAHCCGSTDLTRLSGNGDATFRTAFLPGGADPIALLAADFDRDNFIDVAVLDGAFQRPAGAVWVLHGEPPRMLNTNAATNTATLLAPGSIVAAYGAGLAAAAATAATADWPASLGGATVTIRDETGATHAGRIYYASPPQVNYFLPAEVAPGFALVTVASGASTSQAVIRVVPVSPGIFFAGSSIAAAHVVRVAASGAQTVEPTVTVLPNGQIAARQITLGPDAEQEVLLLYGTGIRGRSGLEGVQALIGNTAATVLYAGPQNEYPGLDQVNILLPKSLRGRGVLTVSLTVDGLRANPVFIRVI